MSGNCETFEKSYLREKSYFQAIFSVLEKEPGVPTSRHEDGVSFKGHTTAVQKETAYGSIGQLFGCSM